MLFNRYIAALCIVYIVFFVIKTMINRRKGVHSEEKRKIREIVKRAVPYGETYMSAYGTESVCESFVGNTLTRRHWYYAVAFKQGDLYLVPLSISRASGHQGALGHSDDYMSGTYRHRIQMPHEPVAGDMPSGINISYGEPLHFSVDNLGMVEAGKRMLTLFGKDRREILSFFVLPVYTKDGRCDPVNISQKEEAEAFSWFARTFMEEVNAANGIADIRKAKEEALMRQVK